MKLLFKIKKVTAFFVVSIFILTHICFLSSAIADCGIDTYKQLVEATNELSKLENTDLPIAQNNLDLAEAAFLDFTERIKYYYIVGILGGGIISGPGGIVLGAAGATIMTGMEATQLMENINNARDRLKEVNAQIKTLKKLLKTFDETHGFDDTINNPDFYDDDGGANNDGGCNDGAYA